MVRKSAGLLLYRRGGGGTEVFLVHPGGPIWAGRDAGAWSIPKGEFGPEEDPLGAARREFAEETGSELRAKSGFIPLKPVRQKNSKLVYAWAVEGDADASAVASNTFSIEWPPRSGVTREFPEIDRAQWFTIEEAREKIFDGQVGLLDELEKILSV